MDMLLAAAGLAALLAGGHWLVAGSVDLARALRVPPLVIGITLVGFGTSAPELVTSLEAARTGADALAVANVVGSNIANVLLILGLAAVLAPIAVASAAFRRDGAALLAVTALGALLLADGTMGRTEGAVLLAAFALYLALTLRPGAMPSPVAEPADLEAPPRPLWRSAATALAGIALVLLGASWLVTGATGIARAAGISEALIGVTLVALGTSLPELVTSAVAARRGESAVALGNVLGSNLFNLAGILGLTALTTPLAFAGPGLGADLAAMGAAAVLMVAMAVTGWRVTRAEGLALLALYAGYVAARAMLG